MSYIDQQLDFGKSMANLPNEAQQALSNVDVVSLIYSIGDQFSLLMSEIGDVFEETGKTINGTSRPESFANNIREKLDEERKDKAPEIAKAINDKILSPIREAFKKAAYGQLVPNPSTTLNERQTTGISGAQINVSSPRASTNVTTNVAPTNHVPPPKSFTPPPQLPKMETPAASVKTPAPQPLFKKEPLSSRIQTPAPAHIDTRPITVQPIKPPPQHPKNLPPIAQTDTSHSTGKTESFIPKPLVGSFTSKSHVGGEPTQPPFSPKRQSDSMIETRPLPKRPSRPITPEPPSAPIKLPPIQKPVTRPPQEVPQTPLPTPTVVAKQAFVLAKELKFEAAQNSNANVDDLDKDWKIDKKKLLELIENPAPTKFSSVKTQAVVQEPAKSAVEFKNAPLRPPLAKAPTNLPVGIETKEPVSNPTSPIQDTSLKDLPAETTPFSPTVISNFSKEISNNTPKKAAPIWRTMKTDIEKVQHPKLDVKKVEPAVIQKTEAVKETPQGANRGKFGKGTPPVIRAWANALSPSNPTISHLPRVNPPSDIEKEEKNGEILPKTEKENPVKESEKKSEDEKKKNADEAQNDAENQEQKRNGGSLDDIVENKLTKVVRIPSERKQYVVDPYREPIE